MRIILYIYLNIHIRFAKSISELILSTNNNDKSKRKRTVKVAFKEKSKILKITILTKRRHCFLSSVRQSLSSGVDKCVNFAQAPMFRLPYNIIIFDLSFMNAVIFVLLWMLISFKAEIGAKQYTATTSCGLCNYRSIFCHLMICLEVNQAFQQIFLFPVFYFSSFF